MRFPHLPFSCGKLEFALETKRSSRWDILTNGSFDELGDTVRLSILIVIIMYWEGNDISF